MNLLTPSSFYQKNINLGSEKTKNRILNYLLGYTNPESKIFPIKNEEDLDHIKDNDYITCPQFNGIKSWIIFVKLNRCYYAVSFPKNIKRSNENLRIHPVSVNIAKELYGGTIMEGIFFSMDEYKYLIIDEVYLLAGQNQLLKPKDDRLNNLSNYLFKKIIRNERYQIFVSEFYQTNRTDLAKLYDKIKTDSKISDIVFYPKNYGKKIYTYTIIDSDLIDDVIKFSIFRMVKTKNPDVYNLMATDTKKKIGLACIPDQETSKKCRQWFKKKSNELLVRCKWNQERKKWIPIEIVEGNEM